MTFSNIIIVGITGVGKTTIGKILADKLNKPFIDLDKYIENTCGVDIPTIFALEGENGFRDRETFALSQVINHESEYVLSLGGGCVIRNENRQMIMRDNSVTVQLIADLDAIANRLLKSPGKRPLLTSQDIKAKIYQLYAERKELYDLVSDITINNTNLRPMQAADKVEELLLAKLSKE